MEWNKDEARRAMDVAEKKLSINDYFGAKKFVNKAQNLYPELDGLKQVLTMIHVYISASKKTKGEADWYRVLGVDPLADDEAVKKQYKKLALLLHPDKNKCKGAEEAFKLVSEAWCVLSDKARRNVYDQKRKSKTGMMQKPQNPRNPASNNGNRTAKDGFDPSGKARSNKPKPPPADWSQKHVEKKILANMECNKDEARRAMDVAKKKLSINDYLGAKKFVNKAQNVYPKLDNLEQVLIMIDVYISASKYGKGNADWYGVLGVDPLADDEELKKQYKKLALLLHPDKNKFHGAEEAFKLVLEAWSLLSDKTKRIAYDERRKTNQVKTGMQRPPNPHKPASNNGNGKAKDGVDKPKPTPPDGVKIGVLWTMCNKCKIPSALGKDQCLYEVMLCPKCGQSFYATDKTQWWQSKLEEISLKKKVGNLGIENE
ncbi:hypothetical protein AALP_AA7G020900 [Arabis alpina]|uniref:J domain-containing protein n=1 Tax=Arabis alpina TaxID=50452 RepID=A0A087GFG0_ARAAL|nr:hypothetical protein AALP_AA7G020900 [Arabis alpina]